LFLVLGIRGAIGDVGHELRPKGQRDVLAVDISHLFLIDDEQVVGGHIARYVDVFAQFDIAFGAEQEETPVTPNRETFGREPVDADIAGAAVADITPLDSQFLYGYPHVRRYSTGVHDPLQAKAIALSDGETTLGFVICDLIVVPGAVVDAAKGIITERTGLPPGNILIADQFNNRVIEVDAAKNIVWKPKNEWSRLREAMQQGGA